MRPKRIKDIVVGQGLREQPLTQRSRDSVWRNHQENRPDVCQRDTALSRTTLRRILNTDLYFFPYRVQILQIH